jgi:hypothetical protein
MRKIIFVDPNHRFNGEKGLMGGVKGVNGKKGWKGVKLFRK